MEKDKTNQIEEILSSAMSKLKSIVDVNTIIGEPVVKDKNIIILPISKVSMGFVAGGGEYYKNGKIKKKKAYPFAGGSGAGVTLTPMGFLTIVENTPGFIRVENRNSWDKVAEILPDVLNKCVDFLNNKGKKNEKK